MSAPGLLLSGRYRLNHRIAVGGMGEVWAADDIRLARVVALKILRPELTGDPEFVERFRTEARITASLNHPGIAPVYDYGEVIGGAGPYLQRHRVPGDGADRRRVAVRGAGPDRPAVRRRTLDVLDQTGRALQQAHARSLVHRDIKPGNLLITPGGQVKITDFGIAKVAHQAPVTRMGMVMGTAQYISPEQAAGQEAVPASDIYSLGVVAYECLAGTLPFPNENAVAMALAHVRDAPRPLPPDVPPAVAGLVMQMLVKDPATRFPNGAALAQAVGQVRGYRRSRPVRRRTGGADPRHAGTHQGGPGGPRLGRARRARWPPDRRPPRSQPRTPPRPGSGARPDPAQSPDDAGSGRTRRLRTRDGARPGGRCRAASRPDRSGRRTGLSVLLAVVGGGAGRAGAGPGQPAGRRASRRRV